MIELKNISFGFSKDSPVFEGLNYSLQRGEKNALTGPNGSGKTTLFYLIMGLLKPWSGEIRINGKVRESDKDFFDVRQRIGLLFQDSEDQLFCPTVEEDIAFGPLNLGKSHDETHSIVNDICEKLGLKGFEKKVTHRLSGGEKRLVALATVAAMKPECFLFDEPVSGLDKASEERFLEYLKGNVSTCIVITHDHDFLKDSVDKVCRLGKNRIEC